MSTSPEASPVNGHAYDSTNEHVENDSAGDQSESDLSDVQHADADADARSSGSVDAVVPAVKKPAVILQDPSDASDNDASDDADFDMADSPVSPGSIDDNAGEFSLESRPAPKRKPTQTLEDEYMRENPELYGLRRSVRGFSPQGARQFTNTYPQSRPTQRRKVVSRNLVTLTVALGLPAYTFPG